MYYHKDDQTILNSNNTVIAKVVDPDYGQLMASATNLLEALKRMKNMLC